MSSGFKIGVDGGGTKTECVLLDASGAIVARHLAPASNPNVVGPEQARHIVTAALEALRALTPAGTPPPVLTHLYMAGSRSFWLDVARLLTGCGEVAVFHDALPVLELATHGQPGLVLHAGTGSFVAARAPDGVIEAIESQVEGWVAIGTQFHPEAETASALDMKIFEEFVIGITGEVPEIKLVA